MWKHLTSHRVILKNLCSDDYDADHINPFGGGPTGRRHLEDKGGSAQHILAGGSVRRRQEVAVVCMAVPCNVHARTKPDREYSRFVEVPRVLPAALPDDHRSHAAVRQGA